MTDLNTRQITRTLADVYGIGPACASGPVGLWAAARCDNPREALRGLNRILARHGRPLCYAPFGDPAF